MTTSSPALPLRSRVLSAGLWTLGGHATSQALRLLSNLIMTRLLVPEMFGVMVLANVIMVGLALFSDIGLRQGIVQSKRGDDPNYLNTVWTIQIIRGVALTLLALGISLAIELLNTLQWLPTGSSYTDPILPFVIAALSFNALIGGFTSTQLASADRKLDLGRITMIELISQIVALVCMIGWAWVDRSIWALVAGSLLASLLRVILSHTMLSGTRNVLHWDKDAFHEVWGFGKWIVLTSIIGFLAANGDRLLLGGLTDPVTLGFYAIAFFMVSAIQEVFSKLIGNVAFPTFSEIVREQKVTLKSAYYKFRLPLDVTTLLAAGLLFSSGHLLIQLLYDDRYQAAGHMIEILCIGLFEVRFSLAGQCFMAMGKPKILVPIILIRLVALFTLLPLAYRFWGLDGALWIAGGSVLFTLPLTLYLKIQHGLFDLKRELALLPLLGLGYGLGLLLAQAVELAG
jgi:O-antigen/teichoic acid export membrane protein